MNLRIIISVTLFSALSIAGITWGHEGIEGLASFIDLPSICIVIGMIVAGAIWSFPLAVTKQAFADVFSTENLDEDRVVLGHEVFMRLSQFAVASGLYGTLIGLVKMLSNMDDPTAIGPAMAVALLTIFYSVILGEFVFKSMATSFITRTESKIIRPNRGHTTIYFSLFTVSILMVTFFLMMLSFAEF